MRIVESFRRLVLFLMVAVLFFSTLFAQEKSGPAVDDVNKKLNIFVSGFPDISYLSDKIDFALFVKEKEQALVTVNIEENPSAGGGKEFIITCSGQEELRGISDELSFAPRPGETEEKTKQALAGIVEAVLVKYAAHTPTGKNISISYGRTEEQAASVKDKWNYWLFGLNFHFNLNRNQSMKSNSFSGGFSTQRITDEWIIEAVFDR